MQVFAVLALCIGLVAGQAFPIENEDDSFPHPNCHSVMKAGYNKNGTYKLNINGTEKLFPCEFGAGIAFTIILNRVDAVISWVKTYSQYEQGFGFPLHDYFAGLKYINYLTYTGKEGLLVGFADWNGNYKYAQYSKFIVGGPGSRYIMHVGGSYRGNVPDDMSYSNGAYFSTYDRPDANGCVGDQRGGWWYKYCSKTLPTGKYYPSGHYKVNKRFADGIYWQDYLGATYSQKRFVMAVSHSYQ